MNTRRLTECVSVSLSGAAKEALNAAAAARGTTVAEVVRKAVEAALADKSRPALDAVERERCRAIICSREAIGRRAAAMHVAFQTALPPAEARALLAALPRDDEPDPPEPPASPEPDDETAATEAAEAAEARH